MSKHNALPTKKTLNLMIRERQGQDPRILIPALVVGVIVLGLFCKFGVVDRLTAASRAEYAAQKAEQELAAAKLELADYDEVEAEYSRYFSDALDSKDMPQPCKDVLAMMEAQLMNKAMVTSLRFSKNTLFLQLNVSNLSVTSELIEALWNVPMVENVSISTATDVGQDLTGSRPQPDDTGVSTVIMTITLREVKEG